MASGSSAAKQPVEPVTTPINERKVVALTARLLKQQQVKAEQLALKQQTLTNRMNGVGSMLALQVAERCAKSAESRKQQLSPACVALHWKEKRFPKSVRLRLHVIDSETGLDLRDIPEHVIEGKCGAPQNPIAWEVVLLPARNYPSTTSEEQQQQQQPQSSGSSSTLMRVFVDSFSVEGTEPTLTNPVVTLFDFRHPRIHPTGRPQPISGLSAEGRGNNWLVGSFMQKPSPLKWHRKYFAACPMLPELDSKTPENNPNTEDMAETVQCIDDAFEGIVTTPKDLAEWRVWAQKQKVEKQKMRGMDLIRPLIPPSPSGEQLVVYH